MAMSHWLCADCQKGAGDAGQALETLAGFST